MAATRTCRPTREGVGKSKLSPAVSPCGGAFSSVPFERPHVQRVTTTARGFGPAISGLAAAALAINSILKRVENKIPEFKLAAFN
jgi:hypothetical protein